MTEADLPAFTEAFQALRRIYPLRADKAELEHILRLYFRTLARYPIEAVTAGAEVWTAKGTKFPKPAEWLSAIPRGAAIGIPPLSDDEAAEHRRAVALGYEDDPCTCVRCQRAGVTHRMRRYVPDVDADDRDLKGLLDGKVVTRGHWIHGEDLQRWYLARDHYLAQKARYPVKAMPKPRERPAVSPTTQAIVMLNQEMQASIARSDALEAALPKPDADPVTEGSSA